MAEGIHYFRLELFVRDLAKTLGFYHEVLGLDIVARKEHAATVSVNNSKFLLTEDSRLKADHYFDRASLEGRRGVGVELVVEVDDVHAMYDRVQTTGYEIYEPLIEQSWGCTDFRVIDPDGYYLRITSK
ncbi:MAG: VOC family protein [Tumebacillaceae bacterium]